MKHVVWGMGAKGPGIDQLRGILKTSIAANGKQAPLAATGAYDATLKALVLQYQKSFNAMAKANDPKVAALAKKLKKGLPETGTVDADTRIALGIDEKLAIDTEILLPEGVHTVKEPLTASERLAGRPGEIFIGDALRIDNVVPLLEALGLTIAKGGRSDKRIAPLPEGRFMVSAGHPFYDLAIAASECAALVQSFGAPDTNRWRRGPRVEDVADLPVGTIVATLGKGAYMSDYSGESHVGIFLWKTKLQMAILDQWVKKYGELGISVRSFKNPHTKTRVDPSRYLDDPKFSYRYAETDASGNVVGYGRDGRLETVMWKTNVIADASEYYVLMSDGKEARIDNQPRKARGATNKQVVDAVVGYIFEDLDLVSASSQKALREALKGVKPRSDVVHDSLNLK